jgi:hypothetical protein
MFNPRMGGMTPNDITTGKVQSLLTTPSPFQRAMPSTQPKSLLPDEVYAVLAGRQGRHGQGRPAGRAGRGTPLVGD